MQSLRFSIILSTATLLVALLFAVPTYGASRPEQVRSFVETLIERGIIPEAMAARARLVVGNMPQSTNVTVTVQELIQHSPLKVQQGEAIRGIVLLAENTGESSETLQYKEGCGILYRIFAGEELVYDHGAHESCMNALQVRYVLEPTQSVMFEVVHTPERHELAPGTYRIDVEYPGYGGGEKYVTVVE